MMANSSCSHWWHAPLYVAMSFTLAFIAYTQLEHATPQIPLPSAHGLAFNASRALRLRGGFHITATLLQISPDLFFPGPESTVFAIQDSVISNLSVPPWEMRRLIRYHTTPSTLPMAELFKKPPGFCFKTLEHNKSLIITNNIAGSVMINHALVSHPDIFLDGPIAVHGILGSFDINTSPSCAFSNRSSSSSIVVGNAAVEWTRIIRLLSSNGFVSFAIGLNAVVDGILQDYQNLDSVTILAPPNSGFVSSSSSPFLDRIVRLHILPHRFTYIQLVSMDDSSSLRTLLPGSDLKIQKLSPNLAINGVHITWPDMFSSNNFVIHGISSDFDLEDFFTSFK